MCGSSLRVNPLSILTNKACRLRVLRHPACPLERSQSHHQRSQSHHPGTGSKDEHRRRQKRRAERPSKQFSGSMAIFAAIRRRASTQRTKRKPGSEAGPWQLIVIKLVNNGRLQYLLKHPLFRDFRGQASARLVWFPRPRQALLPCDGDIALHLGLDIGFSAKLPELLRKP